MTNTGPSTINGNLGLSPGTAVTGFGPGTVNGTTYAADAIALKAQSDLTIAYDDAAARTPAATAPADLGGLTLTPGVYQQRVVARADRDAHARRPGRSERRLRLPGRLDADHRVGEPVKLVNGAQACNVFWKVGSSATLGTGTVLAGNILALTSITMNDGVTLHGRALARNGAVTLINDTITAAHCATGAGGSVPARELDVAAALAAEPGIGANQDLWPNQAVEEALVAGPPRPHARQLDQGHVELEGTWTKGTWTQGHLEQGHRGPHTDVRRAPQRTAADDLERP